MKLNKLHSALALTTLLTLSASIIPNTAMAGRDYKGLKSCSSSCSKSRWYASANLGVSNLFDKKTPSTTNNVNQGGPGWNVNVGYLYNWYGVEGGYNQYSPSRETLGTTEVATTKHYSIYLAGIGVYKVAYKTQIFGKLGAAYNYANKVFTASGAAAGANSGSLYYGIGANYRIAKRTYFAAQWSRSLGNDTTGSADLYSLGLSFRLA